MYLMTWKDICILQHDPKFNNVQFHLTCFSTFPIVKENSPNTMMCLKTVNHLKDVTFGC